GTAHRAVPSSPVPTSCVLVVSGRQLAQRFVDAGAARFELAERVVRGGLRGACAVDRHFEAAEFDHEVVAQEERIETHARDVAHDTTPWIPEMGRASAVPTRRARENALPTGAGRAHDRAIADILRPKLTRLPGEGQPSTGLRDHRHSLPVTVAATLAAPPATQRRSRSRSLAPGTRSSWIPPVPTTAGRQPLR